MADFADAPIFSDENSSVPQPPRARRVSRELPEAPEQGPTPLITAIEAGHHDVVRTLIESGADVDCTITLGFSALHIAASLPERGEFTAILAQAGANVNLAAEEGVSPLMAAAQHGHADSVTALLEAGADANQAGEEACTPLHLVAVEGHAHIVGLLCEAGADPSLAMKNDFTPLDFAAEFNHHPTAELLCSYGATLRADAAQQASRAGHAALATWLAASEEYTTPLHHLGAVTPPRAYALLRDGADVHACAAPGRPTPLSLACELDARGEAPPGSSAELVLLAGQPWSPTTHDLFPHDSRAYAVELMRIGWLLSRRDVRFAGKENALLDAWLTCVLPHAVAR